MKAEGDQFSPVAVNRDKEPNGAQTAQPQLLTAVNTSDIEVNRFVSNPNIDCREAGETTPMGWRMYSPDLRQTRNNAHQCREKTGKFHKNGDFAAQTLVSEFICGNEKQQVLLWFDLIEAGPQVVPYLLDALRQQRRVQIRCRIISALWVIGDTRAVNPLLACLRDRHEKVRAYAACGLGWLQDARAIPALVDMLNDPKLRVQWFAATALERFGSIVVDTLQAALQDPRERVRIGAANILGWMLDARSVEALIAALQDENEEVRMQAAAALGWVRDVRAIAPIARLIEDKSEWTRYVAIQALADIGDEQVISLLRAAQNSPYERVREAAEQALKRLVAGGL